MTGLQSASFDSDDPATQLRAVRQSINKTLGVQEYTERGKQLRRAELKQQVELFKFLLATYPHLAEPGDSRAMCQVVEVMKAA